MSDINDNYSDGFDENVIDLNIDPIDLSWESVGYIEETLEHGYDINKRGYDGKTLILSICTDSDIYGDEKLKLVLKYGANVNDKDNQGISVISGAIIIDKIDNDSLQLILDHGADIFSGFYGQARMQRQHNLESARFVYKNDNRKSEKIDIVLNHDKKTRSLFDLMLNHVLRK